MTPLDAPEQPQTALDTRGGPITHGTCAAHRSGLTVTVTERSGQGWNKCLRGGCQLQPGHPGGCE